MCMRKEVLWHQVVSSVWLWACCDLSYRGWPQTTIRSPSSLLQGETKGLAEQECISTGCAETSVHDWPIHQAVRSGTRQRRAAELSAASKLLGKSGRGFKQASYAILDRKYEDVKRRINYAARARAIVQLEETLSSVPRIYIRLCWLTDTHLTLRWTTFEQDCTCAGHPINYHVWILLWQKENYMRHP